MSVIIAHLLFVIHFVSVYSLCLLFNLFLFQGNRANHTILFDCKIIDYVNHILRSGKYGNTSEIKVMNIMFHNNCKNQDGF